MKKEKTIAVRKNGQVSEFNPHVFIKQIKKEIDERE